MQHLPDPSERERRLHELFVRTLDLPPGTDCAAMEYRTETRWDSVAHLQLIVELEAEFGLTISDDDVLKMTTYKNILDVLERLGA